MGTIRTQRELEDELEKLNEAFWNSRTLNQKMKTEYYSRRNELIKELADNYNVIYE